MENELVLLKSFKGLEKLGIFEKNACYRRKIPERGKN